MDALLKTLGERGLQRFHSLEPDAVSAVAERFYATLGSTYARFGTRGRDACREDLAFHLEFLKPPGVRIAGPAGGLFVLARQRPCRPDRSPRSIWPCRWTGWRSFLPPIMEPLDGAVVTAALRAARTEFLAASKTPLVP